MHEWIDKYQALLELFRPSILSGLSLAAAGAVVGIFVLLRREALLALAMPQMVAAGAAFGLRFLAPLAIAPTLQSLADHTGWPTLPPAIVAVALCLLLIALSHRRAAAAGGSQLAHGLMLPCIYIGALSASYLLIAGKGQHLAELQKMFTGIDIAVDDHVAEITVPILLLCGAITAILWRRWLLVAQSPATAQLAGLHPARWDAGFLLLLSIVIVLGTNALGVVLVLALLFLPAAAVLPWVRRVPTGIAFAFIWSIILYAGGFILSYELDWPLSQAIGGLGAAAFLISHLFARWIRG